MLQKTYTEKSVNLKFWHTIYEKVGASRKQRKNPGRFALQKLKILFLLFQKIEMRKVTVPNFCINFLNKAEKSLPILYDFAVAPPRVRGLKHQATSFQ